MTTDENEQLKATIFQSFVQETYVALQQFASLDDQQAIALANSTAAEQFEILSKIIPTLMVGSEFVASHPTISILVRNTETNVQGVFEARKSAAGTTDPGLALHSALVFALLVSPHARAVLKANGFDYKFMQTTKNIEEPGKILIDS